jgi:hypothetical protein
MANPSACPPRTFRRSLGGQLQSVNGGGCGEVPTVLPRYREPRHSENPAYSERRRYPQYQQLPNFSFRDSEQAGYSERAADPRWVHCSGGRLYLRPLVLLAVLLYGLPYRTPAGSAVHLLRCAG